MARPVKNGRNRSAAFSVLNSKLTLLLFLYGADIGSKHIFSVTGSNFRQYSLKEMTGGYGRLQQERLGPRQCRNGDGGGPRPDHYLAECNSSLTQ